MKSPPIIPIKITDEFNCVLLATKIGFQVFSIIDDTKPKIIIPMHYNNDKLNQETFGKLTGVDVFLKEMGKEGIESQLKLNISKDKLPAESIVVVISLKLKSLL